METVEKKQETVFLTAQALLDHWQGHRRLTRKVIEAFPEDKLFTYSIGGMRPFAELALEMLYMTAPGVRGFVVGEWETYEAVAKSFPKPQTREELLEMWDRTTGQLDSLWPHLSEERFQQVDKAFNQYEGKVYWSILYFIDNEIHHRAQGYVYLRSLGIEPPPFWER